MESTPLLPGNETSADRSSSWRSVLTGKRNGASSTRTWLLTAVFICMGIISWDVFFADYSVLLTACGLKHTYAPAPSVYFPDKYGKSHKYDKNNGNSNSNHESNGGREVNKDKAQPVYKAAWSSVAEPFSTVNPLDLGASLLP